MPWRSKATKAANAETTRLSDIDDVEALESARRADEALEVVQKRAPLAQELGAWARSRRIENGFTHDVEVVINSPRWRHP